MLAMTGREEHWKRSHEVVDLPRAAVLRLQLRLPLLLLLLLPRLPRLLLLL